MSINSSPASPPPARKASFFTTTLPLFVMAHFGHHLMTALPGILLPFIRSDTTLSANGLTNSQVAWVISAFSLAYGFGQLPGGWLADKIGRRAMIAVGIFGVALIGILIGLSTSYQMLLILLVVMGILGGGYHPSATPWISASVGESRQGRAIGFHFVGGGAGFFVAPFIGAAIAATWGWHMSFIVLAIPCAIFGIAFFFVLRRQKDANLRSVSDSHGGSVRASANRWKPLIALITMSFIGGSLGSVMVFFSLYLVDHFSIAKQTAVYVVAISSFAGIWAGPVGGWVSDRIGRLPIIILSSMISGLIMLAVPWVAYGPVLFLLLLISGINMYMGAPVAEAFIMGQTAAKNRSLIYGMYYLAGQGSALFAPLMGLLIDNRGYHWTFIMAGISVILVTLVCGSILWSTRKLPSQLYSV
ncbi:MAG TPA: MFS transporter [Dehalococcoidales bacterium]|nr:MFS transporter [Dehalococcoidales bacterium]